MTEPRLFFRSARARDLAHRLARRENCSVADIVERSLPAYEVTEAGREPAASFYAQMSAECGSDIDLGDVIREGRHPCSGN